MPNKKVSVILTWGLFLGKHSSGENEIRTYKDKNGYWGKVREMCNDNDAINAVSGNKNNAVLKTMLIPENAWTLDENT